MKLPNNEIGISDILQWRDCPRRFVFGMRRHEAGEAPESWSPQNAYGSAVHTAYEVMEQTQDEGRAVQAAFALFARWLEPEDLSLLHADLRTYIERDLLGVRTVKSEDEARVPLFEHGGETIYFRFRLDRLYARQDDDTAFIHIDYKSSKWPKSDEEVDQDLQLWAYNFGIYELYPEIESLVQVYDQLRAGQISTSKSDAQRDQIREWLIEAATALIEDETLPAKFNQWCPWCPIKMDCPVIPELSEYAQARIAKLAPREPKLKTDGSPGKTLLPPKLDPERFDEYVAELEKVEVAVKTLEAFSEEVRSAVKGMPVTEIERYGFERRTPSARKFGPDRLREVHNDLGPEFYHVASLTKAAVERFYGGDKERIDEIMDIADTVDGSPRLQRIRS